MMSMIFLAGSIILSSYLTLSFKVCERYKVHTYQAIVFNYITCVITGSIVNGAFPIKTAVFGEAYFQWAMVMGVLFITLFNMIGFTAQKIGVAVASVSNKLSLIIPILLAIALYGETVKGWKLVGIVLALAAVVLTSYQNKDQEAHKDASGKKWEYLLPFILFIGSGLLDSLINHVQKQIEITHYNHFLGIKKICNSNQIDKYKLLTTQLNHLFSRPPHPHHAQ